MDYAFGSPGENLSLRTIAACRACGEKGRAASEDHLELQCGLRSQIAGPM